MVVIDDWLWRYRVGFDDRLRASVAEKIDANPDERERRIHHEILEACSSFVSLDALLDRIEGGESPATWLGTVDDERLLRVPELLLPYFESKIEDVVAAAPADASSTRLRERLSRLLDRAHERGLRPPHRDVLGHIFGGELDRLVEEAEAEPGDLPVPEPSELVARDAFRDVVGEFVAAVREDPRMTALFDDLELDDFEITLRRDAGFGEYWPPALRDGNGPGELVLHVNDETRKKGNLVSTLAHELLPGHAFFYRRMAESDGPLLDYGALGLVEGWATWCEWHVLPNPFSRFARSRRLRLTRGLDGEASAREIRETADALGDSRTRARQSVISYFQYPGYEASYSLGGIWFERRFDRQRPSGFLQAMSTRAWGDFFRSW